MQKIVLASLLVLFSFATYGMPTLNLIPPESYQMTPPPAEAPFDPTEYSRQSDLQQKFIITGFAITASAALLYPTLQAYTSGTDAEWSFFSTLTGASSIFSIAASANTFFAYKDAQRSSRRS